jgi:AraC family transcriptional regulator
MKSKTKHLTDIRKATRIEIIRRLHHMRQIILSTFMEKISLDDLAKAVCISKYHCLRLYKQLYGITPYQEIQNLRLDYSKHLLQNYHIQEVSNLLNYNDRRAFIKSFKKKFGITPSQYAENYKIYPRAKSV